jgi:hypothetical protein
VRYLLRDFFAVFFVPAGFFAVGVFVTGVFAFAGLADFVAAFPKMRSHPVTNFFDAPV